MLPDDDAINSILKPFIQPWYDGLENPQRTQERVLSDLLQKYASTDYGKVHYAQKINSILDYRANFPILNYAALAPYLRAVREHG